MGKLDRRAQARHRADQRLTERSLAEAREAYARAAATPPRVVTTEDAARAYAHQLALAREEENRAEYADTFEAGGIAARRAAHHRAAATGWRSYILGSL
jgi:hypothetical protein